MDTFLIPLFVTAVLCGVFIVSALIFYSVPVRFGIIYFLKEGWEESTITASWGPVAGSMSHGAQRRVTHLLFIGRKIWSRSEPDENPRTDAAEPSTRGLGLSPAEILGVVLPIIGDAGTVFGELYRQSRFDGMTGTIRIGMENPAATGMLYGGYWASRFTLNASRIFIEIEPIFGKRVLVLDITMRLRIRHPLVLILQGIALIRNPAVRRSLVLLGRGTAGIAA
jgi:hypothetical protein